jgi:hypothetical protein
MPNACFVVRAGAPHVRENCGEVMRDRDPAMCKIADTARRKALRFASHVSGPLQPPGVRGGVRTIRQSPDLRRTGRSARGSPDWRELERLARILGVGGCDPPLHGEWGDRGRGRTVCSGIAATTQPSLGAVFGLVTSCPCWPCVAPRMGVPGPVAVGRGAHIWLVESVSPPARAV